MTLKGSRDETITLLLGLTCDAWAEEVKKRHLHEALVRKMTLAGRKGRSEALGDEFYNGAYLPLLAGQEREVSQSAFESMALKTVGTEHTLGDMDFRVICFPVLTSTVDRALYEGHLLCGPVFVIWAPQGEGD